MLSRAQEAVLAFYVWCMARARIANCLSVLSMQGVRNDSSLPDGRQPRTLGTIATRSLPAVYSLCIADA
jgi:hypothetical protein